MKTSSTLLNRMIEEILQEPEYYQDFGLNKEYYPTVLDALQDSLQAKLDDNEITPAQKELLDFITEVILQTS